MRTVAQGRRNWLFAGSMVVEAAGQQLNRSSPGGRLQYVLEIIAGHDITG